MSDQHRPLSTHEGTRILFVEAHSLTGKLWWLLPPAAALFYPQAIRALYEKWQAVASGERAA